MENFIKGINSMNRLRHALLICATMIFAANVSAQNVYTEEEAKFYSISDEANNLRARYDALIEYQPLLAHDSKEKDPDRLEYAWDRCKLINQGYRSYAQAQQQDAWFVAFPEAPPSGFTDSPERAEIAIALIERAKQSKTNLERSLRDCLETAFEIKIKPFP